MEILNRYMRFFRVCILLSVTSLFLSLKTAISQDPLEIFLEVFPASCHNNCDGYFFVNATGGVPPYSYVFPWGSSHGELCSGDYNITVTDGIGNFLVQPFTITEPSAIIALISAEPSDQSCTGFVTISASGGNPPYSFNWSNGQSGDTITGLCPNTYVVTITDNNGCTMQYYTVVDLYESDHHFNISEIELYPNPVKEKLLITNGNELFDLELINALGETEIARRNIIGNTFLNLGKLSSGIYYLKLTNRKNNMVYKVLKL